MNNAILCYVLNAIMAGIFAREGVTVTGSVRSPSLLQWNPDLTVIEAIMKSGGASDLRLLYIIRGSERIRVNLYKANDENTKL
jgi:protein involved in polysaccharide export with SLBB domain